MSSESSSENEQVDSGDEEKLAIREDLSSLTFEEIMKLKEELGAKVYKEAVLGTDGINDGETPNTSKRSANLKRLNKNRPREMSSKRQVPFLGVDPKNQRKKKESNARDPRFDERTGEYDTKQFKENYQFITEIRQKEIKQLQKQVKKVKNPEEREEVKQTMQKLVNKNLEDLKWQKKQKSIQKEKEEIQKARAEGRQPTYVSKKERRAKELVEQFEELRKTGRLNKHLEKRRKKNTAKDRKKFSFD